MRPNTAGSSPMRTQTNGEPDPDVAPATIQAPKAIKPAEIKAENAASMFGLHLERRAFSLKMAYSKPKDRI
jgi:hypothetical protein